MADFGSVIAKVLWKIYNVAVYGLFLLFVYLIVVYVLVVICLDSGFYIGGDADSTIAFIFIFTFIVAAAILYIRSNRKYR